jgi:hypothetical protein
MHEAIGAVFGDQVDPTLHASPEIEPQRHMRDSLFVHCLLKKVERRQP